MLLNQFVILLQISPRVRLKIIWGTLCQDYSFHNNTNSSKLIDSHTKQLEGAIVCINLFPLTGISLLVAFGIIFSLMDINFKIVFIDSIFIHNFLFRGVYVLK